MGQSWGTILGSKYALAHPENVSAYIGVGQVIDFDEGKILAANEAMKLAKKQGNTDDVEKLKMVEKYYNQISAPDKKMILIENTGHTPFLDKADVFCEEVKKILSEF